MFSKRVAREVAVVDPWPIGTYAILRHLEESAAGNEWATRVRRLLGATACPSEDSEDHRPETLMSVNVSEGLRASAVGRLKPSATRKCWSCSLRKATPLSGRCQSSVLPWAPSI